jgi:hypothetical protein
MLGTNPKENITTKNRLIKPANGTPGTLYSLVFNKVIINENIMEQTNKIRKVIVGKPNAKA